MGFKTGEETRVEATGFVTYSKYNDARDVLGMIERGIEDVPIHVEDEYPSYVYDNQVFKITIVIEKQ